MRVVLVNPAAGLGGSERSLLDVVQALRGCVPALDVRLVLLADGELATLARAAGIAVEVLPLPPELATLGEAAAASGHSARRALGLARALASFGLRFRRRLRALEPALVHTNGMKAHLLASLALRDVPLVVHLRDFPARRPVGRHLLALVPKQSAIVVTNSEAVAREARGLAPKARVRVVYNAIDTAYFAPDAVPLAPAPRVLVPPPPPGGVAVGMVATYSRWKGHGVFLDAAREVVRRLPGHPLRFYIVGGPIYATQGSEITAAELRQRVAELGLTEHVSLVPFQTDIARAYRELDIVVHASTDPEPFGRTIVEAMACERAVVVARAGGAAELFEDGRSALGFEPGNAGALGSVLAALATDPVRRAELGRSAREHVLARFDRAALGQRLADVYAELLGRSVH